MSIYVVESLYGHNFEYTVSQTRFWRPDWDKSPKTHSVGYDRPGFRGSSNYGTVAYPIRFSVLSLGIRFYLYNHKEPIKNNMFIRGLGTVQFSVVSYLVLHL